MPTLVNTAKQRISDFQEHVNRHQEKIRMLGDKAWEKAPRAGEVEIIRQFLSHPECGTAFLNRELSPLLSRHGWVVKFASIFLHQKPKVEGWLPREAKSGKERKFLGKRCELGDLQTIFLYLSKDKSVAKMRSVIFQAKIEPSKVDNVVGDPIQRQLYDDCQGFRYESVGTTVERRLPSGVDRERALQYLFVGDRPVQARTIPSKIGSGAFLDFGEHLLRFLNDSTGLDVSPKPDLTRSWNRIVWDMIQTVATVITTKGMSRNQGLRAVLDTFNSFENHDTFYMGPEGPVQDGFGVQLVIVWDADLDDGVAETQIMPRRLLHPARLNDAAGINESDAEAEKERIEELASLLTAEVSRKRVVQTAIARKSDSLIAALGVAIMHNPKPGDAQYLISLLPLATVEWVFVPLVHAAIMIAKRNGFSPNEKDQLNQILGRHILRRIPRLHSLLRQLSELVQKKTTAALKRLSG